MASMEVAPWSFNMNTSRNLSNHNKRNVLLYGHGGVNAIHPSAVEGQRNYNVNTVRRDPKASINTYSFLLQACTNAQQLNQLHVHILKIGRDQNMKLLTKLVNMYATHGSMDSARLLFDKTCTRDLFLWNAMIIGYVNNGPCEEALAFYYQMKSIGIQPDKFSFPFVIKACASLSALQKGMEIHDDIVRSGFESDIFVETALVAMYAKCGIIELARKLFDKMSKRDLVTWSAMIAGYSQNDQPNEALTLFSEMQQRDLKPDLVTIVSVLPACARLSALQRGKQIHGFIIRNEFETDILGTALVDMYAKCGSIDIARQLFDKMPKRDVVSWNAMIVGYGMHGHGEDALTLFCQMHETGTKPDHTTFIGVLSACSRAGLVEEGRRYFRCMSRDYCITPKVEHYTCLVDLLGRAGHLDEAQNVIKEMPLQPNADVWGALLGACRIHFNIMLAEHVAESLFKLEPKNCGHYVLLSNIYAEAGRWNDVAKVRIMMRNKGLKKTAGCSWIELNNKVHLFLAGDRSHPQCEEIYAMLETLSEQMKEAGYVPNKNFVLLKVGDEEKEHMLCSHSEKLAIAFGLINTTSGVPIRVMKNLRVCTDCHNATKFISKIVRREIIVRDANRFHHFKDGSCSCGDYW
eukprot:Gb_38417 [translate_table: standard]